MENSSVSFAMSPIKKLVMAAILLHVLSLFAVIIIVVLQRYLSVMFFSPQASEFVLPPLTSIVSMTVKFIIHAVITVAFWQTIHSDYNKVIRLRVLSILGLVFVIVVNPVLHYVETWLSFQMMSHRFMMEQIALRNMMFFGLGIRGFGFTALLIASGMAIYYCYLIRDNVL